MLSTRLRFFFVYSGNWVTGRCEYVKQRNTIRVYRFVFFAQHLHCQHNSWLSDANIEKVQRVRCGKLVNLFEFVFA